jgi:hypothetical protein
MTRCGPMSIHRRGYSTASELIRILCLPERRYGHRGDNTLLLHRQACTRHIDVVEHTVVELEEQARHRPDRILLSAASNPTTHVQ